MKIQSSQINKDIAMDWTKLTSDPCDVPTREKIKIHLKERQHLYRGSLVSFFNDCAKDKEVLHIGCYEHDEKYYNSEKWKHKSINEAASECLGLDINSIGIQKMIESGYDAVCMDATSDSYIGKKFDIIVVGDVIEHLTNFSGLIEFCKRHLKIDGALIISTPNPFYIGSVLPAWLSGPMIANFEHTCWLSESTILEICRRHDIELESIYYPIGNSSKSYFISVIKRLTYSLRSFMLFTTIVYKIK
jgi:SAM-dependent methyltransferase